MGFGDCMFSVMPYGEMWRKQRRMFHSQMHLNAVPKYQGAQLRQARRFLRQLLNESSDLSVSVRG